MECPNYFDDVAELLDELHIMGARMPGLDLARLARTGCKAVYHKEVSLWDYMKNLYEIQPNFIFGYWADIPFNATKSNVLWQEATMVGAVACVNPGWEAWEEFSVHYYDPNTDDMNKLIGYEEQQQLWKWSLGELNALHNTWKQQAKWVEHRISLM